MKKVLAALLADFGNSRFSVHSEEHSSIPNARKVVRSLSNTLLETQRKKPGNFRRIFVWLIPFKPQNDLVLLLLPWLICQTKLARFLEVSCKIMHYSCRKLEKSWKKYKKCNVFEGSGKRLLICPLFPQEIFVE